MSDALMATESPCQVADAFRVLVDRSRPLRFVVGNLHPSLPQGPLDAIALRSLLLHPSLGHTVRAWSGSSDELGQPDHPRCPRLDSKSLGSTRSCGTVSFPHRSGDPNAFAQLARYRSRPSPAVERVIAASPNIYPSRAARH
jgi:hypothetical protein